MTSRHLCDVCIVVGPYKSDRGIVINSKSQGNVVVHFKCSWDFVTLLRSHYNREPVCVHVCNAVHVCYLVNVTFASQLCGCARRDHLMPQHMYTKMSQLSRSLGHLSAVYCVLFDRTGNYIITVSTW